MSICVPCNKKYFCKCTKCIRKKYCPKAIVTCWGSTTVGSCGEYKSE
ncbi:MAG: hypothetical protein WBG30_08805 [Psychrilyobacter sp.]